MLKVEPKNGATILDCLRAEGILLESPCNGKGLCGKCKVRILSGEVSPITGQEQRFLTPEQQAGGMRLACLTVPLSPVKIDPLALMGERDGNVLGGGELPEFVLDPAVTVERVAVTRPTLENGHSLCHGLGDRLLGEATPPLSLLSKLPEQMARPEVTLVCRAGRALDIREDDRALGLAVDIGTTTVAVTLMELADGQTLGETGFVNPQKAFGLDVLSRIHYDMEQPGGVLELRRTIVSRLQQRAGELTGRVSAGVEDIYEVAVGGNSTMLHALLGVPLASLGRAPYSSVFTCPVNVPARELGFALNPEAWVYGIPAVSTYIGGDIVSGVLAARLDEAKDVTLFIDIGTNGEIVLSRRGRMHACSCAAGPALEGMNISCGMRAEPGAIEHVAIEGGTAILGVIGGEPPRGLCGSGILEAISQAVGAGIIAKTGRIAADHPLVGLDEEGKRRIVLDEVHGVYITQSDIRQVQLCKGAILSGILTLMERLELAVEDIDRVLVGGQFGKHLDPESLTGAEILPPQLKDRIVYAGNSSMTGAKLCLLSRGERVRAERIAGEISYVELSVSPGYEKLFTKCLQFGGV